MTKTGHKSTDPFYLDAVALRNAYLSQSLRVSGVIEQLIERITNTNDTLNAVWALDAAGVRKAAAESEERYRAGTARALEGIPFLAKDLIDTRDLVTTYGSRISTDHIPTEDAAIVRQLREAGALLLGKSATDEFAWGITNANPHFGPTRNPWNLTRVPGGSSGGSAAALAAGYAPLALGTDTAGSIRIPAAFCGVVGLRPTFGRMSSENIFLMCPSLDQAGPMARSVRDVELLCDILLPLLSARSAQRVGLVTRFSELSPDPEIVDVVNQVACHLREAGIRVTALDLTIPDLYETLAVTVLAEAAAGHRLAGRWPERRAEFGPDVAHRFLLAEEITSDRYMAAQRRRVAIRNSVLGALSDVDAILSPVSSVQPIEIAEVNTAPSGLAFRTQVMEFTALASLTGFPALALPGGLDRDGVPIGIQLLGAPGTEHMLLSLGQIVEMRMPEWGCPF